MSTQRNVIRQLSLGAAAGVGAIAFEGALLGVAVWAAGYVGWLPATNLMPPVHEHTPRQAVVPILEHVREPRRCPWRHVKVERRVC